MVKIILFSITALFFASCEEEKALVEKHSHESTISPAAQIKTVEKNLKEIGVTTQDEAIVKNYQGYALSLKSEFLNSPMILTTAMVEGAPTPLGNALSSKVVWFEKRGPTLYLFESLAGELETTSIPTKKILAEFPVIEDGENIIFDFNKGMKNLVITSDGVYTDFNPAVGPDKGLTVQNSFIEKIIENDKYTFINQVIRLNEEGVSTSLQMRYTFYKFFFNDNFPVKETSHMERIGYFESNPIVTPGTGEKFIPITKFDDSKPINYYYSSNTPEEYIPAIKDAVLYWNKAFGKKVVTINPLPEGITVHEPGHHTIQWVDWDNAGFAYADHMIDPRTGEILQATVYLTSTFTSGAIIEAYNKGLIDSSLAKDVSSLKKEKIDLKENKKIFEKRHHKAHRFTLKGFSKEKELCGISEREFEIDDFIMELIRRMKEDKSDEVDIEAIATRVTSDYLRETLAHEVGHTLGLRHNFAAAQENDFTADNFEQIFDDYFYKDELDDSLRVTNSVMDYAISKQSILIGAAIRKRSTAFKYDQAAIEFGYNLDTDIISLDAGPFCSDTFNEDVYIDCTTFDFLKDPIDSSSYETKEAISSVATSYAFGFASFANPMLSPIEREYNMETAYLPVDGSIGKLLQPVYKMMGSLDSSALLGTEVTKRPYLQSTDLEEINEAAIERQLDYAAKHDIQKAFFEMITPVYNKSVKKFETPMVSKIRTETMNLFEALIAPMLYYPGELDQAVSKINSQLSKLDYELVSTYVSIIQRFKFSTTGEDFQEGLQNFIKTLLFAKENSPLVELKDLVILKPLYDKGDGKFRESVVNLAEYSFNKNFEDFNPVFKGTIALQHSEEIEKITKKYPKAYKESIKLHNWIKKEKKLFKKLYKFKKYAKRKKFFSIFN